MLVKLLAPCSNCGETMTFVLNVGSGGYMPEVSIEDIKNIEFSCRGCGDRYALEGLDLKEA